jgi:Zn-finger nucleic acid-binding protein
MSCPVCKSPCLENHQLETGLQSSKCKQCSGVWIAAESYESWLASKPPIAEVKAPNEDISLSSGETPGIKFCPSCQYILRAYKIGRSLDFSVSRCNRCGGVWFDRNEWDILRARKMHADVHLIFSDSWQNSIKEEDHAASMESIWSHQFGAADFAEIKRIRNWIESHPKKAEIYAYLMYDGSKTYRQSNTKRAVFQ